MTRTPIRPQTRSATGKRRTGRGQASVLGPAGRIAALLSLGWLVLAGLAYLVLPAGDSGAGNGLMTLVAVLLPVALIWIGALGAGTAAALRAENRRLRAEITAVREDCLAHVPDAAAASGTPLAQQIDELARVQKKTEAALAYLSANMRGGAGAAGPAGGHGQGASQGPGTAKARGRDRPALQPAPAAGAGTAGEGEGDQPTLALKTPPEVAPTPISTEDFILALNFPVDEKDRAGFRALARALRDPMAAGLVRSAQDMLTLLSEDGLYMDDLVPTAAPAEVWRQFARGARGAEIAALGGIHDRESLARVAGRLRQDTVFRDVAHHFLRRFDTTFSRFETDASDDAIAAFAETRTARAFMLVGRVSGTFQ